MPLCGLKKSKKQKRDNSPQYRQAPTDTGVSEEEHERVVRENKQLLVDTSGLHNDLKVCKEERDDLRKQVAKLKDDLKVSKEAAAKKSEQDATDGVAAASDRSAELRKYEVELSEVKIQIEDQQHQKKAIEASNEELKSKLESTTKDLDSQRKAADEQLQTQTKEIERLQQELDAVQVNMTKVSEEKDKAPSEEWKNKIETAEAELAKERQQRLDKERENSRLNSEKEDLEKEVSTLKTQKDEEITSLKVDLEMNHKNDTNRLQDLIDDFRKRNDELDIANDKLLTRLSEETAAKVLDNNPNIADLSDPNRPQKLGEQFSQLYDDQWTDATEELEKMGTEENDIIKTLLDLLVAVYKHCKDSAESQISRVEEDLFLPPLEGSVTSPDANGTEMLKSPTSSKQSMSKIPRFTSRKGRPALPDISTEKKTVDSTDTPTKDNTSKRTLSFLKMKGETLPEVPLEVRKGIKEYRKKVVKQVWPVIEKEVMNKLRQNEEFGDKVVDACRPYISKCVEICWMMRVQDPPVCMDWSIPDDSTFNTDVYRAYTCSGDHVEYVVWPVIHLHESGPVLLKGVAQGIKS